MAKKLTIAGAAGAALLALAPAGAQAEDVLRALSMLPKAVTYTQSSSSSSTS